MADAAAPAPNPNPNLAGVERIRDTAKWLIGAYAAVGTVLIAGLQLTSLGKVEDHGDRAIAVVGASAALIAVIAGIGFVAAVLAPVTITDGADLGPDSDLAKTFEPGETDLRLDGAASLEALRQQYVDAVTTWQQKREVARASDDEANKKAAAAARDAAVRRAMPLETLRTQALFIKVQGKFARAKVALTIASVVVGAGVLAFALAANPTDDAQDQAKAESSGPTLLQPSRVGLWIDPDRKSLAKLREKLGGDACDLSDVKAVAVGGSAAHPEVVTLGQDGCGVVRFTVTSAIGIALATDDTDPQPVTKTG